MHFVFILRRKFYFMMEYLHFKKYIPVPVMRFQRGNKMRKEGEIE